MLSEWNKCLVNAYAKYETELWVSYIKNMINKEKIIINKQEDVFRNDIITTFPKFKNSAMLSDSM